MAETKNKGKKLPLVLRKLAGIKRDIAIARGTIAAGSTKGRNRGRQGDRSPASPNNRGMQVLIDQAERLEAEASALRDRKRGRTSKKRRTVAEGS